MRLLLLLPLALLILAGCKTPLPPAPPTPLWVPKVGERVASNYCEGCPGKVGPPYIATVTKVLRKERILVFANEFPNGLDLSQVACWEDCPPPEAGGML